MTGANPKTLARLAEVIRAAERLVVFTGAGISTESGLSDYRSKGGLWDRFRPVYFQEFLSSESAREEYWARKKEFYGELKKARPNAAHLAVARLAKRKSFLGVITQNIDGLHQEAGVPSEKILELHGNNRRTLCLSCGAEEGWEATHDRLLKGEKAPRCRVCNGLQKPATVSFGESLDAAVLQKAYAWSRGCDLMLCVGSTLVVEPAASLPRLAKESGAKLVIVNMSETPLDGAADLVIRARAGEALAAAAPETM